MAHGRLDVGRSGGMGDGRGGVSGVCFGKGEQLSVAFVKDKLERRIPEQLLPLVGAKVWEA